MIIRRFPYFEEAGDGDGSGGAGGSGDGGAGEGAGNGEGNNGNDGGNQGGDGGAGAGDGGQGTPPQRPEYIPENFWNAEKGQVNAEAMAKSWKDTRTELSTLKDQHKPVDKPEAYTLKLPADITLKEDDKVIALARQAAHAAGLSQAQFEKFTATFAPEALKQELFAPAPINRAEEVKKIGPNGDAVISAVEGWGKSLVHEGVISDGDFTEIFTMNSHAEGIKSLNKLREYFGGTKIPAGGSDQSGPSNVDSWYAEMAKKNDKGDVLYDVDPSYRKKMDDAAKLIFGEGPAHSSLPGKGVR